VKVKSKSNKSYIFDDTVLDKCCSFDIELEHYK